jgi:NAD(P)-dependent dehydrogenase (short-subunit alcohol dehydrogenase family)
MIPVTRAILITGAASGIGAACARTLAGGGVGILVHTRRNQAGAEATAQAVRDAGGVASVALGDMADPATPAAIVAEAVARFGRLDVVVANAGFADKTPTASLTDQGFAQSLDAVLFGFLRLGRAALPHLSQAGEGRLIAISSFVAHVFRTDTATFPATAAAKAGVEALVRSLAVEAAPAVTVNAIAPGFTRKDAAGHSALTPAQWQAVLARIPAGRLGTPQDVADCVHFLAGSRAGYITGQVLHVNGGLV